MVVSPSNVEEYSDDDDEHDYIHRRAQSQRAVVSPSTDRGEEFASDETNLFAINNLYYTAGSDASSGQNTCHASNHDSSVTSHSYECGGGGFGGFDDGGC